MTRDSALLSAAESYWPGFGLAEGTYWEKATAFRV